MFSCPCELLSACEPAALQHEAPLGYSAMAKAAAAALRLHLSLGLSTQPVHQHHAGHSSPSHLPARSACCPTPRNSFFWVNATWQFRLNGVNLFWDVLEEECGPQPVAFWLTAVWGTIGLWVERNQPGDMYLKLICVISCLSPLPVLHARRDGEGGHQISAQISRLHSAQWPPPTGPPPPSWVQISAAL